MSALPGPLAGTRVLDLSRVVSGPLCGRMLADLGADVVKIEAPRGDATRLVPPHVGGVSAYYAQMNAGKRNVCLDLKAPGAPDVVARLAASADVLIENFRPGVLQRFGLDAPTLSTSNPRLVYCSITGWGQTGPWKHRRAYAPLVHADIGTLELAGRVRARRPEPEVHQHGDVYPALLATSAVLAALLQRATTGRGQHLDVAMGQAGVYVDEWAAVALHEPEEEYAGFDTWHHYTYRVGDGSYVALVGNPVNLFPAWARCLGAEPSLIDDVRFATRDARKANVTALVEAIDGLTVKFDCFADLEAALEPGMLAAHVQSVAELSRSEFAAHRELFVDVAPGLAVPAAPWRSSAASIGSPRSVSPIGGDNRAVLREIGYTDADIDVLYEAGALQSPAG